MQSNKKSMRKFKSNEKQNTAWDYYYSYELLKNFEHEINAQGQKRSIHWKRMSERKHLSGKYLPHFWRWNNRKIRKKNKALFDASWENRAVKAQTCFIMGSFLTAFCRIIKKLRLLRLEGRRRQILCKIWVSANNNILAKTSAALVKICI